jgi:hypothetical protein
LPQPSEPACKAGSGKQFVGISQGGTQWEKAQISLAIERSAGILETLPLDHVFPANVGALAELPRQAGLLKIRIDEGRSFIPASHGSQSQSESAASRPGLTSREQHNRSPVHGTDSASPAGQLCQRIPQPGHDPPRHGEARKIDRSFVPFRLSFSQGKERHRSRFEIRGEG